MFCFILKCHPGYRAESSEDGEQEQKQGDKFGGYYSSLYETMMLAQTKEVTVERARNIE